MAQGNAGFQRDLGYAKFGAKPNYLHPINLALINEAYCALRPRIFSDFSRANDSSLQLSKPEKSARDGS
jgi:hypothetical protein